jgi:ribosomal-protein-alanine N-acetyltransferase
MLELNFHPFPELKTKRLLLRRVSDDDADQILFLRSDPGILQFLHKEPAASLKDAKDFISLVNANTDENEAVFWGIALQEEPFRLIGTVCIWQIRKEDYRAALGYVLHPEYWRKGIMKEVLQEVIRYGFEDLKLHSLEAHIDPENIASASLLESLGFTRDAFFKENVFFRGKFGDTAIYSRLNK